MAGVCWRVQTNSSKNGKMNVNNSMWNILSSDCPYVREMLRILTSLGGYRPDRYLGHLFLFFSSKKPIKLINC